MRAGAVQIPLCDWFGRRTVGVSGACSSADDDGARRRPAPPAKDDVARKRRRDGLIVISTFSFRESSRLQLALELIQKAPIGAVGNYLLRTRIDHADFVQS